MKKDHEAIAFAKLTGKAKHYCPDWDDMAIDETMPEIEACCCSFRLPERETNP